jgi:CheY-like chemotaxis protein
VNESASVAELQAIKIQLVESLHLLESPNRRELLPALESAEDSFIREITHNPDFHPRAGYCIETADALNALIEGAAAGERRVLEQQVELLRRVQETGREQVHRTEWGMVEAIFPVRLVGRTVYVLQTGPLKVNPFTDAEQKALGDQVGGVSDEDLAGFPVLTEAEGDRVLRMYRAMAGHIEQSLVAHVRSHDLTDQLIQSERTRSLGTLSGGIAHQFNGLLSIILGYSSFIQNRNEPMSKDSQDALQNISEAVQRGRRLTDELLSFAGSDSDEEIVSSVHDALANVLTLLEPQFASSISFDRSFEADTDEVLMMPGDIHQIAFNLMSIVLDAKEGCRRVSIATSNRKLSLDDTGDSYLYLLVKAEGEEGAATETPIMHALEDSSSDTMELRLSSLYTMVRRLQGTVMVGSDSHARIEILLPLSGPVFADIEQRKVKRRQVASRIWVVDDDPLFREMCVQVLEEEGHKICECADGSELFSSWEEAEHLPDLVIVDFSMPEYNGLELRQWIKTQNVRVPVVLVSGLAPNQPDIKKALKMKKTYFLQKPFSFRELSDIASIAMGETLLGE